jgi:D-alanine-D-alanine ligase
MSIVKTPEELPAALENAMKFCREVLIESFIVGQEITVGVLNGKALPIIEVAPKSGFYDYESKYTPGKTDYILPARISAELTAQVSTLSENIYNWIGCRGAARLDYMIDGRGNPYFLEINTIPGMTETSLLPKAAKAAGIEFAQLCEAILESARLDD